MSAYSAICQRHRGDQIDLVGSEQPRQRDAVAHGRHVDGRLFRSDRPPPVQSQPVEVEERPGQARPDPGVRASHVQVANKAAATNATP